MEQKTNLIRVGISIGDVNGIGPEVIIKSLNDHRILQDFEEGLVADMVSGVGGADRRLATAAMG